MFPSKNTLYLIDISSFIFRAFFAIRALKSKSGEPTNAVYGVATMLARLAEEAKPEYLAVIYDSKEPSFRKEIYPEYKANRSAPPDDLVPQFARIEELVRAFGIHSYRLPGVEADDLIATLTKKWSQASPDHQVVIVSSDKDLMQLIDGRVTMWDTMSNKTYGPLQVKEKFGVEPSQIRDYLALVGDSSDNIPGVPSIGPKSATDLLNEFGTLEGILTAAKENQISGKKGEVLKSHEKDARLSAELATIQENLKVEIPFDELKYHFHMSKECEELLKVLDFHTLVNRWKEKVKDPKKETQEEVRQIVPDSKFRTVSTEKELNQLLDELKKVRQFGFDLETTSLNPREAQIVGIAICCTPEFAYYIPVGHQNPSSPQLSKELVLNRLRPWIESSEIKKIGQNLKYDWSVLIENGFHPAGIGVDTMVAAYLLDPEGRHNLQALAAQYLDYSMLTYEEVCGKGKDQISFDQVSIETATRYSAEDAWVAVCLWEKLEPLLKKENLMKILNDVDLPLIEVLADMELQGVCIDTAWLKKLSQDYDIVLKKIEEKVQAYAGSPINLNSPKQLGQLLFEQLKLPTQGKTKTGFSTDARVLETLAPLHEVPELLLDYRELSKLKGTYVDPLPELKDKKTGKIHASFHQTVAATGRLSSSDPNLQNIPIRTERGTQIRRAFIPSPGNTLVSADYSQIELRLLAHMSQDPELIRAFKQNEDVHRRTASELFGVSQDQVTDRQRGIAKAINFGLMYGKSAFGLSQELKIPRKEAQEIIEKYFTRYQAVKQFLDSEINNAREHGFVTSLMGRKRRLPDIHAKNHMIRANAERMAMNTPIQSTAADLMKLAMIEIHRRLKAGGYRARLMIQVHDEVLLDCPKNEVQAIQKLITDCMVGAMTLSVPLQVNSASGETWMDL